jgi:Cof subfamily protein (haloacid dehalogenase superfamily)
MIQPDTAPRVRSKAAPNPAESGVRDRLLATKYRLLAVDLDGTLLDRSGIPHARDVEALKALKRSGVVVTIATGRLYAGTRATAELLGIRGPVACADGSHLVSAPSGQTLQHRGIPREATAALGALLRERGLAAFAFKKNKIIHDGDGEDFLPYVQLWSKEIERADAVWDHEAFRLGDITALVALGSEREIRDFVDAVPPSTRLQSAVFAIQKLGGLWGCILRDRNANKGTALRYLADHHEIHMSETVCVGDWLNDVAMLKVAGRSFAMGQAPAEVRDAASETLKETSETGGGIARIATTLFGI